MDVNEEPSTFGLTPIFKYEELKKITNSFNTEVGRGGYGRVHLGKLEDGREVAVKKLFDDPKRLELFLNEVTAFSRIRHNNLVNLCGCTNPRDQELLLVYEYVPNGTVAQHLHCERSDLTLVLRIRIAVETAEALSLLHGLKPPIIHRDVKTANILLDNTLHVKVADLGICRVLPWDSNHVSTRPQGTVGYRDPEYERTYLLTEKSDVYSLGMVLMELISRQRPVDYYRVPVILDGSALEKIYNNKLEDFVDPKLGYRSNRDVEMVINSVANLAYNCLRAEGRRRPSMLQVLSRLKEIQATMTFRPQRGPRHTRYDGEALARNLAASMAMVRKADHVKFQERVEVKTHNKVELVSVEKLKNGSGDGDAKKPAGCDVGGSDRKEQKQRAGNQQPKPASFETCRHRQPAGRRLMPPQSPPPTHATAAAGGHRLLPHWTQPQASTVMLKIERHCECEACTEAIVKKIRKVKVVEDVTMETRKDLVTVKSNMDMKILLTLLQEKLKKGVEVVP